MSHDRLAIVTAKTAAEVCTYVQLGEEAKKVLRNELTPLQYVELLMEKELFPDAIRFMAYALPKREAVWWACLCVRSVVEGTTPPQIAAPLQAAEKWTADPSEENRQVAKSVAEGAGLDTPAGWTAMAAFWSGGSLGPPNAPVISPGEYLTAHAVAGANQLAAVLKEPEKAAEKYRAFLTLGIDVAIGRNRWK